MWHALRHQQYIIISSSWNDHSNPWTKFTDVMHGKVVSNRKFKVFGMTSWHGFVKRNYWERYIHKTLLFENFLFVSLCIKILIVFFSTLLLYDMYNFFNVTYKDKLVLVEGKHLLLFVCYHAPVFLFDCLLLLPVISLSLHARIRLFLFSLSSTSILVSLVFPIFYFIF